MNGRFFYRTHQKLFKWIPFNGYFMWSSFIYFEWSINAIFWPTSFLERRIEQKKKKNVRERETKINNNFEMSLKWNKNIFMYTNLRALLLQKCHLIKVIKWDFFFHFTHFFYSENHDTIELMDSVHATWIVYFSDVPQYILDVFFPFRILFSTSFNIIWIKRRKKNWRRSHSNIRQKNPIETIGSKRVCVHMKALMFLVSEKIISRKWK